MKENRHGSSQIDRRGCGFHAVLSQRLQAGHPDYQMQYRTGLLRRLQEFSESLRDEMGDLKPEYDLFEYRGYGNGIIEFAKQVDADLVVLGTRGRTNLRDMLWGSTAERVVRHTPCSVLAVKPAGFEHPLGRQTR